MNHKTMTQTNTTVNNRSHRAQIAQDTLRVTERGQYRNRHDAQVIISTSLASAITGTIHYTGAELHKMAAQLAQAIGTSTVIEVTNESTLAAVRRLIADGHADVLCLNFASAKNPGGGFLGGAETQEENLAKSSGLYPCIAQKMGMYEANRRERFCAYLDDMIYSPKVPVFRDDDYDYLDAAVEVSIVTAPAVNHGAVARNDPDRVGELAGIMSRRIELLLALAHFHGHKVLVRQQPGRHRPLVPSGFGWALPQRLRTCGVCRARPPQQRHLRRLRGRIQSMKKPVVLLPGLGLGLGALRK